MHVIFLYSRLELRWLEIPLDKTKSLKRTMLKCRLVSAAFGQKTKESVQSRRATWN